MYSVWHFAEALAYAKLRKNSKVDPLRLSILCSLVEHKFTVTNNHKLFNLFAKHNNYLGLLNIVGLLNTVYKSIDFLTLYASLMLICSLLWATEPAIPTPNGTRIC